MARSRKNASTIGRENVPEPYSKSGVWNIEDATYIKKPTNKQTNLVSTPVTRLDEVVDNDIYYPYTQLHLSDLMYDDDVMKDKSKYNWSEYYRLTSTTRPSAIVSFNGPRWKAWVTSFYENAWIEVADRAELRFGTNAFSIEFMVQLNRNEAVEHYIMGKGATSAGRTSGGTGWTIFVTTGKNIGFYDGLTNTSIINTSVVLAIDTWYYVAIGRDSTTAGAAYVHVGGGNFGITVNGTSAGNFTDTATPLRIGCDRIGTTTTNYAGKIADIKISNGSNVADVYYGGVRPASYFSDSTVVFYQSMLKGHHDTVTTNCTAPGLASGNNIVTIGGGNPTYVQRTNDVYQMGDFGSPGSQFSGSDPISDPIKTWPKSVGHGTHSVYNYVTDGSYKIYEAGPNSTALRFGLGNFTVECWIYLNQTGASQSSGIAGKGSGNSGAGGLGWSFRLNTTYQLVWDDAATALTSNLPMRIYPGGWYHVAAVREGTGSNQFKMYMNGALVYTGTVATDYSQADDFRIWATRNDQFLFAGHACGLRVSNAAKYTTTFDTETTAFIDSSMTAGDDTLLLVGTTGKKRPRPPSNQYYNVGSVQNTARRRSTETTSGKGPFSRTGMCFQALAGSSAATRIVVTEASNVFDYTAYDYYSNSGDFSMEFWMKEGYGYDAITTRKVYIDTRASFADSGISVSLSGFRNKLSVESNGKCLLQDNYTRIEPMVWYHVCIQRVGAFLALYVDGNKVQEIYYDAAITCPANKLTLLNYTATLGGYNGNPQSAICDVRITSGNLGSNAPYAAVAYNKNGKNPSKIDVPKQPLELFSDNTSFLLSAKHGICMDSSPYALNVTIGGRSEADFTSAWNVYTSGQGPYEPLPLDFDTQIVKGDGYSTTTDGAFAHGYAPGGTGNKIEFAWINHLVKPWTIEIWWFVNQADPAVAGGQYSFGNASSAGMEGFQFQILTNSAGTYSWGDIVFSLWTAHNSGVQRLGTTGGVLPRIRPHSWNHIAVCYDSSKTNKLALFTNGVRVASTVATWTKGQKVWSYDNISSSYGCGPFRVSRVARYDNDSTTYTIPTTNWTLDNDTYYQLVADGPLLPLTQDLIIRPQGGTISYNNKKYGNGSWKFTNKETAFNDRILIGNGAWNTLGQATHYSDFTVEFWAQWWDLASGGRDFYATYGNVIYHHTNQITIGVNATGYWQFKHQNGGGTTPTIYQTVTTGILAGTTAYGSFDHIVMTRRSGNFYFYINGQYQGMILFSDYGAPTGLATNYTLSIATNASESIIGHDFGQSTGPTTGWCGHIQDFRYTKMSRYNHLDTSNVMVHAGTSTPALPKDILPVRGAATSAANSSKFLYNTTDRNAGVGSMYSTVGRGGTSPYYYTANNAYLALDSDFTIEFFAKRFGYWGGYGLVNIMGSLNNATGNYPAGQGWAIRLGNYGYVEGFHFMCDQVNPTNLNFGLYNYTMGVYNITPDPVWVHYAITRSGGTLRAYVDGVLKDTRTASVATSGSISNAQQWYFSRHLYGHLSNIRYTRSVVYPSTGANFTPPNTKLPALTNTALLIYPMTTDYGIMDYSSNNNSITYNTAPSPGEGLSKDIIVISGSSPFAANLV